MAEHKHGSMDITAQEQVFSGFISFVTKSVVVIICLVVLLAIFNA
ncbi:aa3-type cytochrome c oxidase subunit IV [Puniceibacterium sediminis]|uniref:Aa3 type cytochrome c oxidase subunit IV n=1 Tax=Puniceibacterium sediminis TaxID=1608407 RepID=A0A238VJY4_9RHOB|nr:aa3-type cytochrome c oxidase subunit IV [Puniceibacterium sediminis]SNR34508.1 aa3 type cytochrome c oxidase subunit IV [Puniceibacterium sediminis]